MANDKLEQLIKQLEKIVSKQSDLSREIEGIQRQIEELSGAEGQAYEEQQHFPPPQAIEPPPMEKPEVVIPMAELRNVPPSYKEVKADKPAKKSDWEKFIGENLINKIGIAITVIGVGIGAKYAIDHDLISPLTRIILGYFVGAGLLGFALKLKANYESFSSVLLSGAMAIMYFITYAAFDFYGLIPQFLAFALMVIFTGFTVAAALHYDRMVISLIGLVGAYAVPFLLSDGSGKVWVLFTYMAIINVGILIVAVKKYWKPLYYASFALTWIIFFAWYNAEFRLNDHFELALSFLVIFFLVFYASFLAYKLIKQEKFSIEHIVLLLLNSFVFYGIGYSILSSHPQGDQALGLFTLANALIHFGVSAYIYRAQLADRNLFYLISGMVLVFITIAIPVQLDGNWVTLLWVGEAALLFWIGRTKQVYVYEALSLPLMALALISLWSDWIDAYEIDTWEPVIKRITPLFNIHFLSSLLFITAFSFIHRIHIQTHAEAQTQQSFKWFVQYVVPAIILLTAYNSLRLEIDAYLMQAYAESRIDLPASDNEYSSVRHDGDIITIKNIWLMNYTMLFLSVLSVVNMKRLKNQLLAFFTLGAIGITLASFVLFGLYDLSELRESYLLQSDSTFYARGWLHLGIRYISLGFVALALTAAWKLMKQTFIEVDLGKGVELTTHVLALWIASSELIHWMDMASSAQSYKLGLSILWGCYALLLIALGIWKKKKHLRIAAITLFGVTLLKLFFYDISHLDTIAKTVVFLSLGILLLIISFLYNKYRTLIHDESSEEGN
jgi:uncharacterized membrane protein